MRMKKHLLWKVIGISMSVSVLSTGLVFAEEATTQASDTEAVTTEAAAQEPKVLGTESPDAYELDLTNSTGQDISYINVYQFDGTDFVTTEIIRLQEALIEQKYLDDVADGSYGPKTTAAMDAFCKDKNLDPAEVSLEEMLTVLYGKDYDDGNFLSDGEVIKADETVTIYYTESAEEDPAAEESDKMTVPDFYVLIRFADETVDRELHAIPVGTAAAQLMVDGDMLYLNYWDEGLGEEISTYDEEKAIYDAAHPAPVYEDYGDYDDYGDYGGYDAGYEDYGYYDAGAVYGADDCLPDGLTY